MADTIEVGYDQDDLYDDEVLDSLHEIKSKIGDRADCAYFDAK